jgi:methyl-accepting chemotaxis protein
VIGEGIRTIRKESNTQEGYGKQIKNTSIFKQLLLQMIAIVCALVVCLAGIVAAIFERSYEREIYGRSQDKSQLVAGEIATFPDGAYGIAEELVVNLSILTKETDVQTAVLENCVRRNPYLEPLYI